jgi:hypothetical protein
MLEFKHLPIIKAVEEVIGKRPHVQTVRRWVRKGIRGVKLEALYINGSYLTSTDDVRRFLDASTQARITVSEPPRLDLVKPVRDSVVERSVKEFHKLTKKKKS